MFAFAPADQTDLNKTVVLSEVICPHQDFFILIKAQLQ